WRHGKNRRITYLPCVSRRNRNELLLHLKSRVGIVSKPTGEPRKFRVRRVTLVQIRTGNRARSGVEIFVRTPNREIDVPIMQSERNVADGVGEIDPDHDSMFLRRFGDRRDAEQLASEKIHSGNPYNSERIASFFEKIDNILGAHGEFPFARAR